MHVSVECFPTPPLEFLFNATNKLWPGRVKCDAAKVSNKCALIPCLLWRKWNNRNAAVFQKQSIHHSVIKEHACPFHKTSLSAQTVENW